MARERRSTGRPDSRAKQFGNFVIGFACGVVQGAADKGVLPSTCDGASKIKMSVPAGNDESQRVFRFVTCGRRACLAGFALVEQHRVDVAFQMVDGNQRQARCQGQSFGIGDADEKRSGETRA